MGLTLAMTTVRSILHLDNACKNIISDVDQLCIRWFTNGCKFAIFGFVSEIINNNAIQEIYVIGMSQSDKDTLHNIHKTLIKVGPCHIVW